MNSVKILHAVRSAITATAELLVLSAFRLSNRTPKITRILKITCQTACQKWRRSVKKAKF